MPASAALLNALATEAASAIQFVGLVNGSGTAVGARVAATATATGANVRLSADVELAVPDGATVAGWRAYSASTSGTDYGGADLTPEVYANAGTYVLTGASTGFTVTAA